MSDGILWLPDTWYSPNLFITFARGLSPHELAVRLGAEPTGFLDPITMAEAESLTSREGAARTARFGACAGWSFAVEQGRPSKAWWAHPPMSAGGVEVLHLTPKPDDPPKEVWYYRDGATIGWFNIGERPDDGTEFLIPALEEAGFFDTTLHEDEVLITLRVLQEHFGLSLPRQQILTGRLPSAVTAKTPPENLGD